MDDSTVAVDGRETAGEGSPRSRASELRWSAGAAVLLTIGIWWVVRTWTALGRAAELFDAHADRYGALPFEDSSVGRMVDPSAPGVNALTRDIDAAAGFLYPFGVFNAIAGGAVAVVAVAVLTGRARPILASAAAVSVAIVTMLIRHHTILSDVMTVLE